MSHLLASANPEAAAAIGNIRKVGIGNRVVYHARAGYMRDKRTSFPADVLHQHEDGSLDLLVHMEREDIAQESHVQFRSHDQPHHCWSVVENVPSNAPLMMVACETGDDAIKPGSFTYLPDGSNPADIGARLDALLKRVTLLEMKRPPGRPPNQPSAKD